MIVLKFGGTSIGSANRLKEVAQLINTSEQKIIVLSAMSGTTNNLTEIVNNLYKKNLVDANKLIFDLEDKYYRLVYELFSTKKFQKKASDIIKYHFNEIKSFTRIKFSLLEEKEILAQGELISTALFQLYLSEQKIESVLLPALNFMRIDKDGEPDLYYIKENINRELKDHTNNNIFITQGFICRNSLGEIDNLKRGGSDYSASIIGVASNAKEIQIWTDIDGVHNNDPRYVNNTKPLDNLTFDEAAELSYFGAKILHPSSVLPSKIANIPVRLKNTLEPKAKGTLISSKIHGEGIKAIAAKDDITAIKIKSGRMLLAHGFMRKVFEIFEKFKTSIDMITTSEVAVSITIDDIKYLNNIVDELKKYGEVEVDRNLTIICVVGDLIAESKGYAFKIFSALQHIPIRMISYGGSRHNISILVNNSDKKDALVLLNKNLFEKN